MSNAFKLLLDNYGKWGAIFLIVLLSIFVWYGAHSNSKDCEKVEILWGMVNYTKGGNCGTSRIFLPETKKEEGVFNSIGDEEVGVGIEDKGKDKSIPPTTVLSCTGRIESKNGGVSNISIHVSARRESDTFKYILGGSNYVELLDVTYSEGRWFKVIINSESSERVGWIHENNIAKFINCDDMVR